MPEFVGFPGVTVGTVATTAQTTFTGGDLNLRRLLASNRDFRFELFAGYRQMHLGDELGAAFRASGGLGAVILLTGDDSIRTRNNFYAGQVGSLGSVAVGRVTVQGQSAFAIGVNASDLDFGRTRIATIGTTAIPIVQTTDGGRLNFFSVAAEVGVRFGFRVTNTRNKVATPASTVESPPCPEQFDLSDTPPAASRTLHEHGEPAAGAVLSGRCLVGLARTPSLATSIVLRKPHCGKSFFVGVPASAGQTSSVHKP